MTVLRSLLTPRAVPPPPRVTEKASIGPGATYLEYEPKLFARDKDARSAAKRGQELGQSNLWIRASERAISGLFATCPWELRDKGSGEPVTEDSAPNLRAVQDLFDKPYTPQKGEAVTASPRTGRGLRHVTSRHMGLSGGGFWYLSRTELLAGTPAEMLYINPARMEAAVNKQGGLVGWVMDPSSRNPVGFKNEELLYFPLEEPDTGHTGVGLVESALASADVVRLADRQAAGVLSSGGRLTGIVGPKEGRFSDPEMSQITRDLRTITDMPDAAKRTLVLKGAIEFTQTSVAPKDLDLVALAEMGRDALLGLWGVPLSQLGGATAAGLNSGERPKHDEATLWQVAVGPRLDIYAEVINSQLLPRFEDLGINLELVPMPPEFDDEDPAYARAKQAEGQPLTIAERRAILGLPPTGDDALDKAVVWYVPGGRALVRELGGDLDLKLTGPEAPLALEPTVEGEVSAAKAAQFIELWAEQGKARGAVAVTALADKAVPDLQRRIERALRAQRNRIAAALLKNAAHIERRPADVDAYFNMELEDRELLAALEGEADALIERVTAAIRSTDGKATLFSSTTLQAGDLIGWRITAINETTRNAIRDLVTTGVGSGISPSNLASVVRDGGIRELVPPLASDLNAWKPVAAGAERAFASELRAETIARTEAMGLANQASLSSYKELGSEMVIAVDGDDDPECAARNGQTFTLEEAQQETYREHPNGTLTWRPVTLADAPPDPAFKPAAVPKAPPPQTVPKPQAVRPLPPSRHPREVHKDLTGLSEPRRSNPGIDAYKGSGYREMNASLRKGVTPRLAKDVDRAMRPLPIDVLSYRGTDEFVSRKIGAVGSTWTDKGFISTTTDLGFAQGWKSGTTLKIVNRKGQKAYYFERRDLNELDRERELLLPRGTKFKVLARERGPNGRLVITLERL